MSCENYMVEADAMQIIAKALDITTLSYQYANVGKVAPIMMSCADVMLTFAPLYHQRWTRDSVRPGSFADIGYLYDTSFKFVRRRARGHRRRLTKAGAQFVICYFDESVLHGKYGLIGEQDHCAEILALLQLVIEDPSVGVVVKTQFRFNSPQNFDEIAGALAAAEATGIQGATVLAVYRITTRTQDTDIATHSIIAPNSVIVASQVSIVATTVGAMDAIAAAAPINAVTAGAGTIHTSATTAAAIHTVTAAA